MAEDARLFAEQSRGHNDVLLQFIKDLELKQPSDISLKTVTVNEGTVSISAATSNKQSIAKFITQLKDIENVDNILVSNLAESKNEYGVITTNFSMTCTFSGNMTVDEFAGLETGDKDSEEKTEDTKEVESKENSEE